MIKLSINTDKIDHASLSKNENGTYLKLYLNENKGGRNSYGNDGFAVQELPKEKREAGIKGPIIGNWKRLDKASDSTSTKENANTSPS